MSRYTIREVVMPNGVTHEVVVAPKEVVAILLMDEEEFVFVKQYRAGAEDYLVEAPAGLIEDGETPQEAAVREAREETGLEPGSLLFVGKFYKSPGWTTEVVHCYIGWDLVENPLPADESEDIEIVRMRDVLVGEIACMTTVFLLNMFNLIVNGGGAQVIIEEGNDLSVS